MVYINESRASSTGIEWPPKANWAMEATTKGDALVLFQLFDRFAKVLLLRETPRQRNTSIRISHGEPCRNRPAAARGSYSPFISSASSSERGDANLIPIEIIDLQLGQHFISRFVSRVFEATGVNQVLKNRPVSWGQYRLIVLLDDFVELVELLNAIG
jgi:hypothetical protein